MIIATFILKKFLTITKVGFLEKFRIIFFVSVTTGFHGGSPTRKMRRTRIVVALPGRRCQDESFSGKMHFIHSSSILSFIVNSFINHVFIHSPSIFFNSSWIHWFIMHSSFNHLYWQFMSIDAHRGEKKRCGVNMEHFWKT